MTATLVSVLLLSAFAGNTLFVGLYFFRSEWSATPFGQNLMAYSLVAEVLISLSLLRMIIGAEAFAVIREPAIVVSFVAVNAVIWWRLVLLIKTQREARNRDNDKHPTV